MGSLSEPRSAQTRGEVYRAPEARNLRWGRKLHPQRPDLELPRFPGRRSGDRRYKRADGLRQLQTERRTTLRLQTLPGKPAVMVRALGIVLAVPLWLSIVPAAKAQSIGGHIGFVLPL